MLFLCIKICKFAKSLKIWYNKVYSYYIKPMEGKDMKNDNKVIWKLWAMSCETALGVVIIGACIYLTFILKINVMPEGIAYADTRYVLYQFANIGLYALLFVVFIVGLGLIVNGIEKMSDAVNHGIKG